MTDQLIIASLSLLTRIGVYDWEQRIDQTLILDLTLPLTCENTEDTLNNTVDYQALCHSVTEFVQSRAFALIETVAVQVAGLIKTQFGVSSVTVSVKKPQAIKNAAYAQVTVTR